MIDPREIIQDTLQSYDRRMTLTGRTKDHNGITWYEINCPVTISTEGKEKPEMGLNWATLKVELNPYL